MANDEDNDVLMDRMIHPDIQRVIDGEDLTNGGFQRAVCLQLKIIFERQLGIVHLHNRCKTERIKETLTLREDTNEALTEIRMTLKDIILVGKIFKFFAAAGVVSLIGGFGWLVREVIVHLSKGWTP